MPHYNHTSKDNMQLLLKQRFFSWFDSFDIYDEQGNTKYVVRGELGLAHKFSIYDSHDNYIGSIAQRAFTLRYTFNFDVTNPDGSGTLQGSVIKQFTLFNTSIVVNCNRNYSLYGSWPGWDYTVYRDNQTCATFSKQLFNLTDTYVCEYANPEDELMCIVLLVAIDAIKCSQN